MNKETVDNTVLSGKRNIYSFLDYDNHEINNQWVHSFSGSSKVPPKNRNKVPRKDLSVIWDQMVRNDDYTTSYESQFGL